VERGELSAMLLGARSERGTSTHSGMRRHIAQAVILQGRANVVDTAPRHGYFDDNADRPRPP